MELYNSETMPLSNNPKLKEIQEKILLGKDLTIADKLLAGRDHPVKEIAGYKLKPDHCYRAINKELFEIYQNAGFIFSTKTDDEYAETIEDGKVYNNNKGIDWYLGGVDLKYGDIILECPAYKKYFTPTYDNGCGMSIDPSIRFFKSSGAKNPIPFDLITNVFEIDKQKAR